MQTVLAPLQGSKESCRTECCGLYCVCSLAALNNLYMLMLCSLYVVAAWVFCITLRVEALSDLDDAIPEQVARSKSDLKAHDNSDPISQRQAGGNEESDPSQGAYS